MMNYQKGRNVEQELTRADIQIGNLPENFLWMHVKGGTNVSNVVDFAKNTLQTQEHRAIVWTGYGGGVGKTISAVEILKRDFSLHQVTRICYKTNEEYWEPLLDGLESIVVKRNIPCIHIFVSIDAIDPKTPGYQFSEQKTTFWHDEPPSQPASSSQRNHSGPKSSAHRNSDNGNRNDRNHKKVDRQKTSGKQKSSFSNKNNVQ